MTEKERALLKQKIIDEIAKAQREITEMEKMAQPITPENSIGRVSRMDAINNKSVVDAALRTKRAKLTKLQVALKKIDEKSFGNCVMCNNPIQPMRLMFMPESTRCVRCAAR
ncbi:MAG: TraR/DksA C4-type zinc finger protein [Bacteroidota bacterium]